jgi:hypothetical protein
LKGKLAGDPKGFEVRLEKKGRRNDCLPKKRLSVWPFRLAVWPKISQFGTCDRMFFKGGYFFIASI